VERLAGLVCGGCRGLGKVIAFVSIPTCVGLDCICSRKRKKGVCVVCSCFDFSWFDFSTWRNGVTIGMALYGNTTVGAMAV